MAQTLTKARPPAPAPQTFGGTVSAMVLAGVLTGLIMQALTSTRKGRR